MFSLKELFEKSVKISLDESYYHEKPEFKCGEQKNWYYEIRGKKGFIYPQSMDNNTVCVCTTIRIGKRLLRLFGDKASKHRETSIEFDLIIPVELVRSTFRYIKPFYKRQLTEEQKRVVSERLKAYRLSKKLPVGKVLNEN